MKKITGKHLKNKKNGKKTYKKPSPSLPIVSPQELFAESEKFPSTDKTLEKKYKVRQKQQSNIYEKLVEDYKEIGNLVEELNKISDVNIEKAFSYTGDILKENIELTRELLPEAEQLKNLSLNEFKLEIRNRIVEYFELRNILGSSLSAIGKIFVAGKEIGSGTMIGPDLILTAGHCIHPGEHGLGAYFRTVEFTPSYWEERSTKPRYKVKHVRAHPGWENNERKTRDIAILKTTTKMDVDTFMGIQIEIGRSAEKCDAYGYPLNDPFKKEFLYKDPGEYTDRICGIVDGANHHDDISKIEILAMDKIDLTEGASGGPQIPQGIIEGGKVILKGKTLDGSEPLLINGVNSSVCKTNKGIIFSPYFGEDIGDFIQGVLDETIEFIKLPF